MLRFSFRPASDLTLNALRLALLNYVAARHQNEGMILRVENIGIEESALAAESRQILEKCAIIPQQVLYQSESLHRYQQFAVSLLEKDQAFLCTCPAVAEHCNGTCRHRSSKEWQQIRDASTPYVIRIKEPEHAIVFDDLVKGPVRIDARSLGAFILLRSDGTPTPSFATSVDDMLGAVSTVIRCDTYLEQAAEQIHIRNQLGFTETIRYAHVAPIRPGNSHDPLPTVPALLKEGFLPDAILNYLLLGEKQNPEIFTLPDAIASWHPEDLAGDPPPYDPALLRMLNRQHLRQIDDKRLSALYGFADTDIGRLIRCHLDEAATLKELDSVIKPIFAPKPCDASMQALSECIAEAPWFEHYSDFYRYLLDQNCVPEERLVPALKQLITGADSGPALETVYPHLQSYITEVARCQP